MLPHKCRTSTYAMCVIYDESELPFTDVKTNWKTTFLVFKGHSWRVKLSSGKILKVIKLNGEHRNKEIDYLLAKFIQKVLSHPILRKKQTFFSYWRANSKDCICLETENKLFCCNFERTRCSQFGIRNVNFSYTETKNVLLVCQLTNSHPCVYERMRACVYRLGCSNSVLNHWMHVK